jgi:hypothetical protein
MNLTPSVSGAFEQYADGGGGGDVSDSPSMTVPAAADAQFETMSHESLADADVSGTTTSPLHANPRSIRINESEGASAAFMERIL